MCGGYVLEFSDAKFGHFFNEHGVEIHGERYPTYGGSKAKKMRAFWDKEPDKLVGRVLSDIESRLKEAQKCPSADAHLSVIFLYGSVLEGVLPGAAQKEPERFNRFALSPKRNEKVKRFHEWTLDVAGER